MKIATSECFRFFLNPLNVVTTGKPFFIVKQALNSWDCNHPDYTRIIEIEMQYMIVKQVLNLLKKKCTYN